MLCLFIAFYLYFFSKYFKCVKILAVIIPRFIFYFSFLLCTFLIVLNFYQEHIRLMKIKYCTPRMCQIAFQGLGKVDISLPSWTSHYGRKDRPYHKATESNKIISFCFFVVGGSGGLFGFFFFYLFETTCPFAIQTGLKLTFTRLALSSWGVSCLNFLSAGITGTWQHTRLR